MSALVLTNNLWKMTLLMGAFNAIIFLTFGQVRYQSSCKQLANKLIWLGQLTIEEYLSQNKILPRLKSYIIN